MIYDWKALKSAVTLDNPLMTMLEERMKRAEDEQRRLMSEQLYGSARAGGAKAYLGMERILPSELGSAFPKTTTEVPQSPAQPLGPKFVLRQPSFLSLPHPPRSELPKQLDMPKIRSSNAESGC